MSATAVDLTAQIGRIRSGETSAAQLIDESLASAEGVDGRVGALLERFDASARAAAVRADAAPADDTPGLLSGVPLAIKANIALAEAVPTSQSRVHDPAFHRGRDARVVAKLRGAGATIIGTTTMAEHAIGRPDPALDLPIPRNPWDLSRWPGGSSSGTAIAISLGIVAAGLGTDSTGSCRIPAAFCGVTGLRPAAGSLPMDGIVPTAPSLDVVGPMARSARDCRLLLTLMRGADTSISGLLTAGPTGSRPVRILVPRQIVDSGRIGADTASALTSALEAFVAAGIAVDTLDLPFLDELIDTTLMIMVRETYDEHKDRLAEHWADYGRSFRRLALLGALVSDEAHARLRASAASLGHRLGEILADGTVLALPTWPTAAPPFDFRGGAPEAEWNLAAAFCATGNPCLALPMGVDRTGMPLSLQLVGTAPASSLPRSPTPVPPGVLPGEDAILRLGELFQLHTDHHLRVPRIDPDAPPPPIPDPDAGLAPGSIELLPTLAALGMPLTAADAATVTRLADMFGLGT